MPDKLNETLLAILAHQKEHRTVTAHFLLEVLHELHRDVRERCAQAVEESEGTVVGHGSEQADLVSEVLRVAAGRVRQVK